VTAASPATLDLAVLGLLLLFAVAGAFSGALRQLFQLGGVVAGWLAATHLAPWLARPVLGARPQPWERGALAVACFVAAVVLVGLVGRAVARRLQGPGGSPGPLDRALGALLGGAKAGLAAWVVLSALALARGPVVLGSLRLDLRASDFGSLAARHNLLEAAAPDEARLLERLLKATRDPEARARLRRGDPELERLLADPRVRALLERAPAERGPGEKAGGSDKRGRGDKGGRPEEPLSDRELKALIEQLRPE
jgi:membrane protein required for colicin V production